VRTYEITTTFITPPECQGQAVERSYALAADDSAIIERVYDGGDGTTTYTAYDYPNDDDGSWEPQNGRPALGRERGECKVITAS
jgi:hypothetical protein